MLIIFLCSYVGTLHEINAEQSTIALENVYSFGTEDRPVAKFIPPSQDKYGFIVFRGGDVKDIKIAEDEPSQPSPPPNMPNDPAILVCSSCPTAPVLTMMNYFGCKHRPVLNAQNHVEISVAFLLSEPLPHLMISYMKCT